MPFEFIRMIEACWLFSVLTCQCLNFFAFHLTNTSVQNVVLIAFDRYLALSNPFLYAKRITLKPAILVAMASWVVSSVGVFALLYTNGFFQASVTPCVTQCPIAVDQESSLIGFVVTLVLPCSIMFVLYLKIFAIARRHVNAIRAANSQGKPNAKLDDDLKRSERKAAKALGILVLVFLLCVVPYFLASVLADFIPGRVFEDVLSYTSLILYLNSSFNPILYALFYPWFQKSMKMILTGCICTQADSGATSTPPTTINSWFSSEGGRLRPPPAPTTEFDEKTGVCAKEIHTSHTGPD
ncbi:trace amine-associated receptor 7e-like [Engraulis encrasicolus]|uniref:trace amine-associated receptor 7e-like n=1 Tax=Engraulis encrasicolus TaxID=184585 RepID=UPI002FD599B4